MQAADKRVRSIYSVIASSNRLEILRILNTQGPLSYSELKSLAGFKSKKESGKFAYHLRKLVRQTLITLNRSERKYSETSLGRLILNLTRQIEEQSMVESGKLYVRTSKQAIEEFNIDRITQALVRESAMPLEVAQRITGEAEARLHKFQTSYLTGPLIREMVNTVLLEHGFEEYRHRLTRLGIPVFDITALMDRVGRSTHGSEMVFAKTAQRVFTEYLLLTQLPKDVADNHLSGDIHISNTGTWGIMPDTVFLDLDSVERADLGWGGKMFWVPRIKVANNLDETLLSFLTLLYAVGREVSTEVCFQGFDRFILNNSHGLSSEQVQSSVNRTFQCSSLTLTPLTSKPIVSLQLGAGDSNNPDMANVISAILRAYLQYVSITPVPAVKLVLHKGTVWESFADQLLEAVKAGGSVLLESSGEVHSYLGVRNPISDVRPTPGISVLHSLSLNLPRLSRESSHDASYFRAKLALLIQSAIPALTRRKELILESMRRGLLPTLAGNPAAISTERIPLMIQLLGLEEAVTSLMGDRTSQSSRLNTTEKIIESAVKTASERAVKLNEEAYVIIMPTDGASRIAALDAEKYGRSVVKELQGYSHSPVLTPDDLEDEATVSQTFLPFKLLNGGYSVSLALPSTMQLDGFRKIITKASSEHGLYRLGMSFAYCRNCGSKTRGQSSRCISCRSTALQILNTWGDPVRDAFESGN